jgi:hypothetical protein
VIAGFRFSSQKPTGSADHRSSGEKTREYAQRGGSGITPPFLVFFGWM